MLLLLHQNDRAQALQQVLRLFPLALSVPLLLLRPAALPMLPPQLQPSVLMLPPRPALQPAVAAVPMLSLRPAALRSL